ncbi:type I restriction enzyme M protein [Desulfonatronum thiosulfatophilum]|uniref:site-specific DNA-methyltransferase (adenine-specific) n=2 Tax=Desulfonatronum thiosulfatophilum TaxID=617002 RepID=A0A1G6AM74_9BACT|nr:type I restriction enzyme M protein [Desulfonatronum thiosulfatophilum]
MLRANSNYASNEYFLPVMGLIFLRHAYSRYLTVKNAIEAHLPTREGRPRALTKEDFSQKSAIFLRPEAQFDTLVALSDGDDRAKAIIDAMESIEADYESLRGVLPKSEYQELSNPVLGQLLRTLNPEELKRVSGDVFGRIYEYFLTQFADQKAHDGGEFFTPVSLVSLIAHVIDPQGGSLLDPASGSGGMFVQSARIVEEQGRNPVDRLTFYGLEKNATTIRLAKMNLAVHGLEGDIKRAITYYEDPHELLGKADYVMANPPFNVDEIDADKVKTDPRLPFGLPGVNKKGKVSNGNYIWISYFYSYLNEQGRAGFVMSSQASSAGRDEAKVRQKLVETGDVDIMIAIRSNFFYTRTVPCELWFLNRSKPEANRDKVLMIDARNIYRKVTRKIFDFSPEQERNLLAIVWLYRSETERYLELVAGYCRRMLDEAAACFNVVVGVTGRSPLPDFTDALATLRDDVATRATGRSPLPGEMPEEFDESMSLFTADVDAFRQAVTEQQALWEEQNPTNGELKAAVDRLSWLAESSRNLVKQIDMLFKLTSRLAQSEPSNGQANPPSPPGKGAGGESAPACIRPNDLRKRIKALDEARALAVEQLKHVRYFWKQAKWLTERFPNAELREIEGLVKLVDRAEIAANDWSLTPGRYVGVAPEMEEDGFDFEEALREIHVELEDLNTEAVRLAATIKKNFEELGI